jgi:hypothetical protein
VSFLTFTVKKRGKHTYKDKATGTEIYFDYSVIARVASEYLNPSK